MDIDGVKKALEIYFEANTKGSGAKMKEVFHEEAFIYGYSPDGAFNARDLTKFAKVVDDTAPDPTEGPFPPMDDIISIDFTGENTAAARVRVRVANNLYTDVLSFARINGKWCIVSKLYSGKPMDTGS